MLTMQTVTYSEVRELASYVAPHAVALVCRPEEGPAEWELDHIAAACESDVQSVLETWVAERQCEIARTVAPIIEGAWRGMVEGVAEWLDESGLELGDDARDTLQRIFEEKLESLASKVQKEIENYGEAQL